MLVHSFLLISKKKFLLLQYLRELEVKLVFAQGYSHYR
jgi:hypothetical protein